MMHVLRTAIVTIVFVVWIGGVLESMSSAYAQDQKTVTYRIERNGKKIGRHSVVITTKENGRIDVDINFRIRVKFAFITAFKMDHSAHEEWSVDGRLLNMRARTERKTGVFDVALQPHDEGGFQLSVNDDQSLIADDLTLTSFSFPGPIFNDQTQKLFLLDTLSGLTKPSTVHPRGKSELIFEGQKRVVDYYEIIHDESGEITHRVWQDADKAFLKIGLLTKDGHHIEYYRE